MNHLNPFTVCASEECPLSRMMRIISENRQAALDAEKQSIRDAVRFGDALQASIESEQSKDDRSVGIEQDNNLPMSQSRLGQRILAQSKPVSVN